LFSYDTKNVRWESSPKRKLEIPLNYSEETFTVTDIVVVPYEQK
jgi:hypothetical protein